MTYSKTQHLVLGGARSGKSKFAENLVADIVANKQSQKVYLATATAGDDEMAQRIDRHQSERDQQWQLIEEQTDLASILNQATEQQCILIDCLTLWLSNCLHQECWPEQKKRFIEALTYCSADVVMVSNEVGSGIIPMGELSRQFVDESGWLHQHIAQICSDVSLVVAGLSTPLKSSQRE